MPLYFNFGLPGPFSYSRRLGGRSRRSAPPMPVEEFQARMGTLSARSDEFAAQRAADPALRRKHRIGLAFVALIWAALTYAIPLLGIAVAVFALIGWAGNRAYGGRQGGGGV
jgi:hypothetical protein